MKNLSLLVHSLKYCAGKCRSNIKTAIIGWIHFWSARCTLRHLRSFCTRQENAITLESSWRRRRGVQKWLQPLINFSNCWRWLWAWYKMISKGSFILAQKRKRHRFQIGSLRIQFNVHNEQKQRSKISLIYSEALPLLESIVSYFVYMSYIKV